MIITNFKATRETVFNAANDLQSKGIKVTANHIRQQLQGGSQTTIHKYLTEWRKLDALKNNVHVKKQNLQLANLIKELALLQQQVMANNTTIEGLQQQLSAKDEELKNLKTINNAYSKSTETALDFFTQKMQEMQTNFDQAVTILSQQVQHVINSSWQELQKISHSYQDKLVDNKLKLLEQEYLRQQKRHVTYEK